MNKNELIVKSAMVSVLTTDITNALSIVRRDNKCGLATQRQLALIQQAYRSVSSLAAALNALEGL